MLNAAKAHAKAAEAARTADDAEALGIDQEQAQQAAITAQEWANTASTIASAFVGQDGLDIEKRALEAAQAAADAPLPGSGRHYGEATRLSNKAALLFRAAAGLAPLFPTARPHPELEPQEEARIPKPKQKRLRHDPEGMAYVGAWTDKANERAKAKGPDGSSAEALLQLNEQFWRPEIDDLLKETPGPQCPISGGPMRIFARNEDGSYELYCDECGFHPLILEGKDETESIYGAAIEEKIEDQATANMEADHYNATCKPEECWFCLSGDGPLPDEEPTQAETKIEGWTAEQRLTEIKRLRKKAKWHVARAGSGGSWKKAQAYNDEADEIQEIHDRRVTHALETTEDAKRWQEAEANDPPEEGHAEAAALGHEPGARIIRRRPHNDSCYDCGSIIEGEHSSLCDLAEPNCVRLDDSHSKHLGDGGGLTQWLSDTAKAKQQQRLALAEIDHPFEPAKPASFMLSIYVTDEYEMDAVLTMLKAAKEGKLSEMHGGIPTLDWDTEFETIYDEEGLN